MKVDYYAHVFAFITTVLALVTWGLITQPSVPDPPFGPLKGRLPAGAPTKAPTPQPAEEETPLIAAIPKPSKPTKQVEPSTEDTRADLEYSRMIKTLWWHFVLLSLVLLYSALWLFPYQNEVASQNAVDVSRTLIALDGTLLTLVVAFAAFYFAILDNRRLGAIRRGAVRAKKTARDQTAQMSPEQKFKELTEEAITNATLKVYMTLVSVYRANMKAVSKLLVAISSTLGSFLLIAFVVYVIGLQTTGELAGGLLTLAYSVTLSSPIVAVGDAILMTYYLTKDVAGRSLEEERRDVGGEQASATEAVRTIPLWEWLLQSAIVPLIPLVTLVILGLYFQDRWAFAVAAFGSILIGDFFNFMLKQIEKSTVRRSFALFRYVLVLTVFSLFAAQAGALLQNAVQPLYKSYFLGLLTVEEATVLVPILVFIDVALQHKEFLPNDERTKTIRERLRRVLCLRKPPQQKVGPTQRD